MSSSEPDEDVKHGIVNIPLKKVRGSINDVWNHKNPDVSTAVKLTPYRPTFTEQPTERFLPETQFSPFEGIPADSCAIEVIEVDSEEEEDYETWRRRVEEERDCQTSTLLASTTSSNNNISTTESYNICNNNITASVSTKSGNKIATTTLAHNKNKNNHKTTTTSTQPRHTNNNITTTTPSKSHNNDDNIAATKPRNNTNNSVTTHASFDEKTPPTGVGKAPLVIRATLGCLSEVERMKKGMAKVSKLKKIQERKEIGRRRPTVYSSESEENSAHNNTNNNSFSNKSNSNNKSNTNTNNNTSSSNTNNNNNNSNINNNSSNDSDNSNSRGSRRGLSHEGVDVFVPKKKTALRKTSVSDIFLG